MNNTEKQMDKIFVLPLLPPEIHRLPPHHIHSLPASDCWSLLYADSGKLEVSCAQHAVYISPSQGCLLEPNHPISLLTFPHSSVTIIRLKLYLSSKEFAVLRNKALSFSRESQATLKSIVDETEQIGVSSAINIEEISTLNLDKRSDHYAAGQYLRLMTEQLLIQLKRSYYMQLKSMSYPDENLSTLTYWEKKMQTDRHYTVADYHSVDSLRNLSNSNNTKFVKKHLLFDRMMAYLKDHSHDRVTLDTLSHEFRYSKTYLSQVFKTYSGKSILNYYNELKIEEAKLLILNEDLSFTEISDKLGFTSMHYFSHAFKRHTSMSPSEYLNSIVK